MYRPGRAANDDAVDEGSSLILACACVRYEKKLEKGERVRSTTKVRREREPELLLGVRIDLKSSLIALIECSNSGYVQASALSLTL
eukprot:scaffold7197_cov79-Skeletonema_dohrnii-CCMP3373.AAC.8